MRRTITPEHGTRQVSPSIDFPRRKERLSRRFAQRNSILNSRRARISAELRERFKERGVLPAPQPSGEQLAQAVDRINDRFEALRDQNDPDWLFRALEAAREDCEVVKPSDAAARQKAEDDYAESVAKMSPQEKREEIARQDREMAQYRTEHDARMEAEHYARVVADLKAGRLQTRVPEKKPERDPFDFDDLRGRRYERPDLSWLKFEALDELPDEEPERVIEGLLHIGEKLGITAGSKKFKTWILLHIGYCIANGLDFLGFKTNQVKVIFFDLELSRNGLKRRLRKIQKAVGEGDFENIKICSLRGKASLFCKNFEKVTDQIKEAGFRVVVIDPVYKFLLGKNENDNGVVADMLERLTVFCMEANVALIFVHHHSKGNQADKNSLDRSSGAGSWSRDPDSVFDLVDHKDSTKEEKIYSAEITVREFPPIEDFVVRWKFPTLVRDTEGLDPAELKQPKAGRPKQDNGELILAVARAWDEEGGITARSISEATFISRRTIQRRIKELMPERLVKAPLKGGYQLSLSERQKMEQFKTDQQEKESTEE